VDAIAARLTELETPLAGIVDADGTWGHVQWEKALSKAGIGRAFGTEFTIESGERRPRCWALAEDLAAFYRLSSSPPKTQEDMAAARGVVRFAGAALSDPEAFDYIDINPRSRRAGRRALELHRLTGKPLVATSDNDYPAADDRLRFLAWDDSKKMTPQHILSEAELRSALSWLSDEEWDKARRGAFEVAERIGSLELPRAPIINVPGDLDAMVEEGRRYRLERGHIKEWTEEYQARLERELAMIRQKQFESYFIVVGDMVVWAKERMLVGPARGSSAGSLACYLLRITEVDPLIHHLIFERFIDVNRNDLPDIDIDFNDQKRELVFEYLGEKYGAENVARIGSVNRLKPRSVIAHVGKKLSIPHGATFGVMNALIEYSSGDSRYGKGLEDTMANTAPGREFMERYPEATLMGELENHASHTGVHAAGIIVSNVPVIECCTVRDGVAHIDKMDAEHLNLLKIDALGLRTLGVIEDCGVITPQELYDLPLDDPAVLEVFNEHRFSGIFQFEGGAQRRVSMQVPINRFEQVDHVTALARPGPLGGGAADAYASRNDGREEVVYRHPSMADYLGDTLGVVLYQEQVMRIVREIGNFSWEDTSTIRKAMSGRKGKEFFDRHGEKFAEGASRLGIAAGDARQIWDEICSFGAWGMNKSHTTSYAMISYWCAYMKRYHQLEYAAACLRNAKDDEQTMEVLRELSSEGVSFTPFDPDVSLATWAVIDGRLVGGFNNLMGIGNVKAANLIEKRAAGLLTPKDREKLLATALKHDDLRPAHTRWGAMYADPEAHNVHGAIKEFGTLKDGENGVVICKVVAIRRRDENEALLVGKRGHEKRGQTLFLDVMVVDDSVSKPVTLRVRPENWFVFGEKIADRAIINQDWLLVRGRWLGQFGMMIVKKVKCLTNGDLLE
jgi:DNA-directed DNA polymerase III PolC